MKHIGNLRFKHDIFALITLPTILTSHNLLELSLELLNNKVPLEFISTEVTSPKCEEIVLIHKPDTMSQNFIVLSFELEKEERGRKINIMNKYNE
jgi:hypothetical protein